MLLPKSPLILIEESPLAFLVEVSNGHELLGFCLS